MSTFAEYTRKKKKKELDTSEVAKRSSTFREYTETVLGVDIAPTVSHVEIEDDIAPTASRNDSDKENKKWYQGWLKKSEGNFGQAVGASGVDLAEDTATGAIGSGEKLLDALMAFAPAVNNVNKINAGQMLDAEDWKEHDKLKKSSEEFIKKDLYNEAEVAKKIITTPFEKRTGIDVESMSVFDEKADSLAQSAGQMVVTVGGSLINPTLGTALLGGTSFGSEMENALNNGATYDEAMLSSAITAGAEILSEKISGGISLGGKTLDDLIPVDKLAQGISNKVVRNLINIGIDATGEGFEEIVSGILSAVGQKMTYMEEKELKELFSSEEALESFLGGAILGGISSTGKTAINTVKGKDSLSGLSKNEKAVFDKIYNDTVAKKESDGKKLTQKEKNEIYDDVLEKLEKGRIDTDTIGSMFAEDSYKKYMESAEKEKADLEAPTAKLEELNNKLKSLEDAPNTVGNSKQYDEIKRQIEETEKQIEEIKNNSGKFQLQGKMDSEAFELLKGTKLAESYNEKARKRQHFEADLTKYDSKQQAVIQQAIDSGILNNTNQTHEFVDWLARVSADKGVSFDFMNNQRLKESGFALEGKTVNGFRKGNNITVNIQSGNELRTVVGHEITHVLEGSPEFYNALASSVKTFAEAKGIYQSMYNTSFENYKNVYKDMTEEEYKKAIEKEVTADLVGEYIFSDADFVRRLSTKNRNVFEKVYDEIKYFLKTVTAGSDAEKQLLKAKKIFEEVYRESNTENVETAEHDDVQYSIEVDDSETLDFLNKQVEDGDYYVTYKSMSFWGYDENGNAILRSPMAEYVDGQLSNAYLIPKDKSKINWYKATETIDEETGMPSGLLVKYRKEGNKTDSYAPASENQDLIKEDWSNLFFNLKKKKQNGKWSDVPARYNPYEHSSDVMLNDQFKTAFERDNLVTVKMIVPKSEDGGAYRAKYSKDATGWTEWKSGDLATQIGKQKDFNRNVFLSRYSAPVEIVPDSEVAKAYQEYIEGTSVEVPDNLVPPNLLKELKKLGVPIKESGKLPKGNVQMSISTEYDSLPKPKPSLDPTSAQLQKDSRSVRDVRNDTMLKNDYSIEEVDQTNQFFDEMGEFMKKAGMTYKYIGLEDVNNAKLKITYDNDGNPQKIVLSAMVKNGDYPVNFDFTSICKKRQSISLVVKELAKRQTDGKRTLDVVNMSAESLWKINEELRKEGLETACLGCFVESKRYNIQNFSTKATNMWNTIVNEVRKEQGIEGNVEYFNFAEGTDLDSVDYTEVDRIFKDYATQPNRTSPENRMRALIRSGGAMYQKYLQPSDLMTPEGIEAIKSMSSKKNNFYGILQGVYGQASPKEVMGFSPYNSEIALLPEKKGRQQMADYIKSIGGVRMQSFSDFLVANVYDYMQMVGDLASRRLPAHAYTKEIAFAKIFGMTGIKVNMSVMFDIDSNLPNEYAGLTFVEDVNGDEEYNGVRGRFEYLVADQKRSDAEYEKTGNRPYVQSIPFDEAVALQRDARYSKNVGIIGVGYSDNHILKMLGDDDIRYVIPYHASSLPAIIKDASKIRKATDYTDSQTIRKLKSITDENGNTVDFNEFRKQFGTVAEAFGRLNELVQNEGWQVQYGGQGKSKFNLYRDIEKTNDPRQTVENYLEYCAKNGLMPVFDQFAGHENYYKLIYDFDPYDSVTGEYAPQTAVSNVYDGYDASKGELSTEAIQELIDGEMFIQNEKNRVRNEKIPSVVDSVLDQLGMKEDVQHSISDESQTEEKSIDGIYGEDIAFVGDANIAPTTTDATVEEMPIRSDYDPQDDSERILGEDLTKKNADKIRTIQAEIKGHYVTRDITKKEFNDKIAKKESEYESLNRKDTKKAVDLRNQITRLETRRDSLLQSLDNKIERANKRIESIENESRFERRKTKQKEYRELFGNLMGDTSTWVDKKFGIQYQTNTLHRNLRDIVRDASGKRDIARADALYDELQGSVNKNEAKKNREANEVKDAFREMKINNAESTYIQMLGELRHNPDTTLTQDVVDEFYNKNKGKIDTQKVDKAIEEARKLYDSLYDRVNASLSEHGFKEMGYRKGYFPHFTDPKQNWLAKLLNWKVNNDEIPTDIAGITETFEPQRTWQSFDKHRKTDTTDYNFLKGLDNYVNGALDWIYHIEDIQKHRAFETEIRYRHSSEEVQKKIDEYRNNPMLSTEEADTLIQNALREAQNPLNNFVTDLHTRTNILAGKKSSKDRNMESDFNRHAYSFMTNVTNRVTANQVVGSVSSALTNFIPITQSWGQVNPTSSLVGMKQTIQSYMSDDGVVAKSDFLTNRLAMNEALYKDAWDKIGEKVGGLMEIVDNFTSQTIWRSKYYENIKNGMSEEQAIKNADQFAENVIGGRSKGNMPTIFHAKNPVSKMFTSFQLEVANQYGYMFKDMPQDIGKEAIGKLVKGWVTIFVGAYAYNALYSTLTGRDSAFDPFGIIEDFIRDLSGDDDDEEKDIAGAIGNLTSNIVEEIPFVGGLLGGGRIPISSALPYNASIPDAYKDVTEGDWKSVMDELSKPLYYSVLPMGGGQIRKTVQGLSMFDEDLPVSGSYTKSGSLRFPVEDTFLNKLQAGVFGQYASSNAREYFDREQAPLKEKQIREYIDVDLPISEYWDYREGLKGLTKLSDKADYINSLDLPIDKKNLLVNNQSDREEPIDLTGFNDDFENFEEFDFAVNNPDKYEIAEKVGGYKEYKKYKEGMKDMKLAEKADYIANLNLSIEQKNALINGETDREEPIDLTGYENYSNFEEFELAKDNPKKYSASLVIGYDDFTKYMDEISEIRADKDSNGKTINGSAKRKKTDYINSLDLDYGQRIILYRSLFDSEADKKMYNADIVEYLNNRDDISYEEMVTILEALDFKVYQDGTVTW